VKKVGIEEQNMPPGSNIVKSHPHPESTIPLALFLPPHGAGIKPQIRRRCVKKMFPSPLALKPRFFSVARCRFAIRNSRPSPPWRSCILLVSEKSPSRWFVNPRVVEVPADAERMAISADTLPQENV
jgi:hypothetical protein